MIDNQNPLNKMLADATKLIELEDWQRVVGVLIDKIHIKEDLVYFKHTDQLCGSPNMGDIDEQLLKYENILSNPYDTTGKKKDDLSGKRSFTLFIDLQFP